MTLSYLLIFYFKYLAQSSVFIKPRIYNCIDRDKLKTESDFNTLDEITGSGQL
jgi:hypothetical protein